MKIEGKNRGGEATTPATTAWPEAGKCMYAKQKKKEKRRHDGIGYKIGDTGVTSRFHRS